MSDGLREDVSIYPILIELASCLCSSLDEAGGPGLCACGLMSGSLVLDYCGGNGCETGECSGQAWVRLIEAFPSSVFPSADAALTNCASPWAYQIEVGVSRCAPMGQSGPSGYTPPSIDEQVGAMRLQTADLAAMRRAITCCFADTDRDYLIGLYNQIEASDGGCLGGTINIWVREDF